MALEGDQGGTGEQPSVHDFFDSLDERFGTKPCPVCGTLDWHYVLQPVAFATQLGSMNAELVAALAVCRSCRFVRMHMDNPLPDVTPWLG